MTNQISVEEYAKRDYSGMKKGEYMEVARDMILERYNEAVNQGEEADERDLNRISDFDNEVQSLADNSVFRYLVRNEGAEAAKEKWPLVEKGSDELKGQFTEYYKDLLLYEAPQGEGGEAEMTVSEYVSGLAPKSMRSGEEKKMNPESKLKSFVKPSEELEEAYERLTKMVATKLLVEDPNFGKEFLNAIVVHPEEKQAGVYEKLEKMTKKYLKANHVLDGKSVSKTLEQLESGELGEKLVDSIKEDYKKAKRMQRQHALNNGGKAAKKGTAGAALNPMKGKKPQIQTESASKTAEVKETKEIKTNGPAIK